MDDPIDPWGSILTTLRTTDLLDSTVYEYIRECSTYKDAIACLDNLFVKSVKEVFARHRLTTCQQKPEESIDEFLQRLKALSVDCNFTDVSVVQCKEAAVRDASWLIFVPHTSDNDCSRTM